MSVITVSTLLSAAASSSATASSADCGEKVVQAAGPAECRPKLVGDRGADVKAGAHTTFSPAIAVNPCFEQNLDLVSRERREHLQRVARPHHFRKQINHHLTSLGSAQIFRNGCAQIFWNRQA
jgi:hypothetical protein